MEVNARRIFSVTAGVLAIVLFIGCLCYAQEPKYTFSETEDKIYNTLLSAGYTKAGACGILGNIAVEDPSFNADLYGNGGITYGLFQWNNIGNRKDQLVRWCNNRSLYYNRPEGQIAFALYELNGGDVIAERINSFLKSTNNPRNAAMEFAVGFERCIGNTSVPDIDAKYDGFIYPERFGRTYQALYKRMDMAEKYFNGYKTDTVNSELVYKIGITPTPGLISELEERLHIEIERSIDFNVNLDSTEEKVNVPLNRFLCVVIGYFCGCIYLSLLFVDRKKLKEYRHHKMKEIPHGSKVLSHLGVKKASYFFINDILKLLLAIAISVLLVKGLSADDVIIFTGFGVVIGNAYPFWNKFSGGLGFTVTILLLILYMPIWGVLSCIIGLYLAAILQSLTIGVVIMSFLMIPFTYFYKSHIDAGIIAIILILLIVSHQRVLYKYIDKKVLHSHYLERKARIGSM